MNQTDWTMDSHTMLYGVIGDPVRHSRSPLMMNRAFRTLGINAAYGAFHITPAQLRDAVNGIKAFQFQGVNVTIPHKVAVMPMLDELDDGARMIGAVNTIVNREGKLIGYNTDGIGYVRSLREEMGINIANYSFLIIGAGGAARGVVYALAKEGAQKIWIANRTKERAVQLANAVGAHMEVVGVGIDEIAAIQKEVQVIVNTSPIGMAPHVDAVPIQTDWFHDGMIVSDIVYTPLMTQLLLQAKARGARIHQGLGMFIHQGAYAFEYWTGQAAPIQVMREAVEAALIKDAEK